MKSPTVSWAQNTNVYEVNLRQYTSEGTFQAFAKHLPRLKAMGVEVIWLMPITPISKIGRLGTMGSYYACSSYTALNPEFGQEDDFLNLVRTIHNLGLKIIIDWVANHTGKDHEWMYTHPDWYAKDTKGNFTETHGWSDVYDLDYTQQGLRDAMVEAMQFWVKNYDIDGFRCDMAHLVPLSFWQTARAKCDAVKPLFWLAECDEDAYLDVFDVNYAWKWMHATENFTKGKAGLNTVVDALRHGLAFYPQAQKLYFTSNHDENSWNGTEYEKYGQAARLWAIFTCVFPGTPLLYSGQELPNQKRLAFFEKDAIQWKEKERPELESFYQNLLHFRKNNSFENFTILPFETENILAFQWQNGQKNRLVIFHFSDKNNVTVSVEMTAGKYISLLSGIEMELNTTEKLELPPFDVLVYCEK